MILLAGCSGSQPRSNEHRDQYIEQSGAVFAQDPVSTSSADPSISNQEVSGGWSVMLINVAEGGMETAKQALYVIQTQTEFNRAFIEKRPTGIVIAYGDYLGKDDPQALADLKRIQSTEIDGVEVFANATLIPPSSRNLRGTNPAYDLRTVKQRFGERAVYTLQIGLYGRSDYQTPSAQDLAEFRRAAEQAVVDLRNEGVMAFYYHAPARSMVTVGVFSEQDYDSSTLPPIESSMLRDMRKRFPHNLLNGQGIQEAVRVESGKTTRIQASQLVGIPKN